MSEKTRNLMEQFMKLYWLMGKSFHHSHHSRGPMSSPYSGQGRVLKVLSLNSEISQKDLAEILGVRPQSLGELLVKLESSGFIVRKQSDTDKRIILVSLTEKGRELIEDNNSTDISDDIFSCFTDDEKEQFGIYLQKIIDNLSKNIENDYSEQFEKYFRHGSHGKHRYY